MQLKCKLKSDDEWQIRQDKRYLKSWNEPTSALQEKELLCQVQDEILYTTKSEGTEEHECQTKSEGTEGHKCQTI